MGRNIIIVFCLLLFSLSACEETDVQLAADAGMDAIQALILSDSDVYEIAAESAQYSDERNTLAPPENRYAQRLYRLVGEHLQEEGLTFNYGVYLSREVNAFAMADGSIRMYSGLMDLLSDGELRFVVGHEMGHVLKQHIRKKIQLAYAASAVRKGIASQNNAAGDVARSILGSLAESLMNAQFSQFEEKEADDYGLAFLKREQYKPHDAVSALEKLAALGSNHTFLSSHPDPAQRAARLQAQLEGRALSIEETQQDIMDRGADFVRNRLVPIYEKLREKMF